MDARGNHVGYMAEQETSLGNMIARQWYRTHRSFVTHVFDRDENEVLRVCLRSQTKVYSMEMDTNAV
jgi:Scramblase